MSLPTRPFFFASWETWLLHDKQKQWTSRLRELVVLHEIEKVVLFSTQTPFFVTFSRRPFATLDPTIKDKTVFNTYRNYSADPKGLSRIERLIESQTLRVSRFN